MATGVAVAAVAVLIAGCGGGESSESNEPTGTFDLRVTEASFPTDQQLGQTSLLRLGVRNDGDRALPSLAVTITVGGESGRNSSLPFTIRERQSGLAQPDRPVWVLSANYPKLNGSEAPGGSETANKKTFQLGELEPGETTHAVWKLSAVRAGRYTVLYQVDASLSGSAKARTAAGAVPGGAFRVHIDSKPLNTEVTDSGEIVEIPGQGSAAEGVDGDGRPRARVVPRGE